MADRDEDSGRYTETYPLSEFREALKDLGGAGGTQEVAEIVSCEYRTANAKLHKLQERGEISYRKVGNAYLWSIGKESQ